jgi:hypothetical protein
MKLIKQFLLGLAFAAAAGSAAAVSFTITSGAFSTGTGYGTGNGQLDAIFSSSFTPQSFNLNPGQSASFAFGNVRLRESCINTGHVIVDLLLLCGIGGDETDNLGVTANLTFTDPLIGLVQSVAIVGAIAGPVDFIPGLGITDLFIQFDPVTVNFGAGGVFTVNLDDMVFSIAVIARPVRSPNRLGRSRRQAQRVEHELEAQSSRAISCSSCTALPSACLLEIGFRLLVARLPQDAVRERQLRVRAGADAEIVAEGPVVQVVARLPPRLRVGRHFVVL